MQENVLAIRNIIIRFLDFFYPLFRPFMDKRTYRYAACGGSNTLLDIFLYFISYNFILQKEVLYTPIGAISPHIAAFLMAFCISFPTGFFLAKYVVFSESTLRGRVQLVRYFGLAMICLLLNYIFLKLFVEQAGIYPTPAKILTSVIVVFFSYMSQKYFTFKVHGFKTVKD
ncbi:MAG TPA: GtrA family protein [Chitinophagaceae bacterium]|jgi:Predicted membrane protein